MADLSAHRGTASAILAAAVVAAGVIVGANAIVKARDAAAPAAVTPIAQATPKAAANDAVLAETGQVKLTGLKKWQPAKLPKRLKLKPVVRHAHKIITRVTAVSVAVGGAAPAQAAAPSRKSRSHGVRSNPATRRAGRKHPNVVTRRPNVVTHAKPPAVDGPTAPPFPPAGGSSTPAPPAPPVPPGPPAPPGPPGTPPPLTTPTGRIAMTGRSIAGQTLTAAWTGADPALTTYQWQLCDPDGNNCQSMATETNPTYLVKTSDIGKTVRVVAVSGSYFSTSRATDQIESGL